MIINFDGNRPQTPYIKMGVQGNNLVDELVFLLLRKQNKIDLYQYTPKLKIASKNNRYAEITTNLTVEHIAELSQDAQLKITYNIPNEATREGKVDLQLSFEKTVENAGEPLIWQTQIITITFDKDIDISEEISTDYPDIIKELTDKTNNAVAASQIAVATAEQAREIEDKTLHKTYKYKIELVEGKPQMIFDEIQGE